MKAADANSERYHLEKATRLSRLAGLREKMLHDVATQVQLNEGNLAILTGSIDECKQKVDELIANDNRRRRFRINKLDGTPLFVCTVTVNKQVKWTPHEGT